MEGFNQERRGLFDGLKVPFDVNAILLSALGLIVFLGGVKLIELMLDIPESEPLLLGIFGNVTARLGYVGTKIEDVLALGRPHWSYTPMAWIAFLGWFSVVWAFFAGAVCRIAAMKIAREEGLELKDALRFGGAKFVPNLLSIVFVVAIVGFFYLVCNSTIAGLVGRIPWIGEILVAILFFLVLLSSFFIVFAGVLGILGFNLAAAAIATEASDTFDGVSRAWNYILARPWQVLLTYGLTFAYVGIFLFCGHQFEKVAVKSLSLGGWGMGHKPRILSENEVDKYKANDMGVAEGQRLAYPGKAEFLYKRLVARDPHFLETVGPDKRPVLFYPQYESDGKTPIVEKGTKAKQLGSDEPPGTDPFTGAALSHQNRKNVWPAIESSLVFSEWLIWGWLLLAKLVIYAYAISYFFSAMTTVYFLLRKDVEGDDYTEINLEEDEDEDDAFESDEGRKDNRPPEDKKALPIVATGGAATVEKKDDEHKH